MKKLLLILVVAVLFVGCKAYEKVIYLQDAGTPAQLTDGPPAPIPDPIIKVGDLLTITVNSLTPEAAQPFNLPIITGRNRGYSTSEILIGTGSGTLQNYLVDALGNIVFPVIGTVQAAGKTKSELTAELIAKMYPAFIKEKPIVLMRFANFNISVLGEVKTPGSYPIDDEKISILGAITRAGDLTIYGNRANVLLIRENNDRRETIRLDLRDPLLVNSPYYYLQQNDVLYIEQNKTKSRTSAIGTAETITISVVGTLVSLTTLIINILK